MWADHLRPLYIRSYQLPSLPSPPNHHSPTKACSVPPGPYKYIFCRSRATKSPPELANPVDTILEVKEEEEEEAAQNKLAVGALYKALNGRDVETVHSLLAPDIEWWFHGPPSCQHMMRLLTGSSPDEPFVFDPVSVAAFGPTVLVEGHGRGHGGATHPVPWVHAWTVTDGVITQVREYFNTSLTVTRLGGGGRGSTSRYVALWQSRLHGKNSVPGLMLAI